MDPLIAFSVPTDYVLWELDDQRTLLVDAYASTLGSAADEVTGGMMRSFRAYVGAQPWDFRWVSARKYSLNGQRACIEAFIDSGGKVTVDLVSAAARRHLENGVVDQQPVSFQMLQQWNRGNHSGASEPR